MIFISPKNKTKQLLLLILLIYFIPSQAQAHLIYGVSADGFFAGFKHPLTGFDHFLAMFSVGLWGAQIGGRSIWTLPVTFPLIMVVGGILGIANIPLPGVEIGIALSILVLGSAIALNLKPSEWIVLSLISIFAICHGYAHGAELPNATNPADFAVGFVISTGLIHIVGIGVGIVSQKFYSGKLTRILGTAIILGGIYFLFMAL